MPRKPQEFTVESVVECRWCNTTWTFLEDDGRPTGFHSLADHVLAEHPESFDEFRRGVVATQQRILQLLRGSRAAEAAPAAPSERTAPEPTVAMDLTDDEATWLKRRRASAASRTRRRMHD
jgi:hypothetical protein